MTKTNRIKVKKEIYLWAIKESQKDFEEIQIKFNSINDWINQNSMPTFRQLEDLANYLKVPFGYMFLDKPPKTNIIEAEFRTIGNKIPNISKNLRDTVYDMSRKQDWISEYRKDNGWDKLDLEKFKVLSRDSYIEFAEEAKSFLKLDEDWYKEVNGNKAAYNKLREALELKGIIVMQNGVVGFNNHRKLDIGEFRGFMLYDEFAPLIFVNTNDSDAGKIFTLIHEYIHVLFEEDDIFIHTDAHADNTSEYQINNITAELLMPKSHIKKYWNEREKNINQIEDLSKLFNVSKLALAIKLKNLQLIGQSLVEKVNNMTEEDIRNKRTTNGGDYWNTYKSRYSSSFVNTVVQGAESGEISFKYAFDLLNVKAKNYDILKESVYG